jgi:HlyD family secretion protein
VLASLLGASGIYGAVAQPWGSAAPALLFHTVAVSKGAIAAQVTASGTLSARRTVQIGAQVSGRVVALGADFNSRVTAGDVLARLDDSGLQAQRDQLAAAQQLAIANRAKAEVAVRDAERQLERQRELAAAQLVAAAEVERAEVEVQLATAQLAAARAQVGQAAAQLRQSQVLLGYTTIVSPIDGVVLARAVDVGQTVAASLQAPTLFTLAEDLARMQIDTAVAEADVGRLAAGLKAAFTVAAFPGESFEGVVRQVRNAPTRVQGVVTYDAVIDVDNAAGSLRPGMTANVTFLLEEVKDAVTIPNLALRFQPSEDQLEVLAAASGERGGGGLGRGGGRSGKNRRGAARVGFGGPNAPSGRGMGGLGGFPRAVASRPRPGDRHAVWKLENGKPKRVMIRPGLTDGSSTQMVEGELKPTDLLITEIHGS